MMLSSESLSSTIARLDVEECEDIKKRLLSDFKKVDDTGVYLSDVRKGYDLLRSACTSEYDRLRTSIDLCRSKYDIRRGCDV